MGHSIFPTCCRRDALWARCSHRGTQKRGSRGSLERISVPHRALARNPSISRLPSDSSQWVCTPFQHVCKKLASTVQGLCWQFTPERQHTDVLLPALHFGGFYPFAMVKVCETPGGTGHLHRVHRLQCCDEEQAFIEPRKRVLCYNPGCILREQMAQRTKPQRTKEGPTKDYVFVASALLGTSECLPAP